MILDTSFLVDLIRGDRDAHAKARQLDASHEVVRVPAPALFELWEGIEGARNPPRDLMAVRDVVHDYLMLPLGDRHAMRAGTLSGSLARRGIVLDDVDALIAGMALEERDRVLTRNLRDFARVPDLDVETY